MIEHILNSVKASLDHPLFYPRVFALIAKEKREVRGQQKDPLLRVITEEYEELSRRIDSSQIQDGTVVRNILRSRQLAKLLIDEKHGINLDRVDQAIKYFEDSTYSLGPNRQHDSRRQEHILKVLKLLKSSKELQFLLKKFTRPLTNQWAEELIRQTLQIPPGTPLNDVHAQQAALAAWLCFLRQNVGSCFATAPAKIIHDEQPEIFLKDLLELISTGGLKRVYGGVENSAPLSASWGAGDLKKPVLLRLSSKGVNPEIWNSPALVFAFEAAGLLDPSDSVREKIQQLEKKIVSLIQGAAPRLFLIMTAEEIITSILLLSQGLTERELKDYQNRPKSGLETQMLMLSIRKKSTGGIGEKCEKYLAQLEAAKNAFKSMADNALLKAWEFTLASFSDIKYEFARWNFYSSLGLQTNEPEGIGQCIYQIIQHKLDQANRKVQEIQYEYEMVYTQLKGLETRIQRTSTEKELEWLKVDYQSKRHEFFFLEEQRNDAQQEAGALIDLYDTLHSLYVDLFRDYFQEVYDADMQEVTTGPYDDSPAGFRLLYKHGRSNTSQWTRIYNQHDFIDALTSFFVATEPQVIHAMNLKKIEKDLADVVTGIINHVKTKEFLESAFQRMAVAHHVRLVKNPLDHLDLVEKKPWVYTSGGVMNTLISSYYCMEEKPKKVEKWIENEIELLVFIADTIKQIPPALLDPFIKGKRASMLMQSPTHAFELKPMLSPFKEAWMDEEFTYTSIRDRFVQPAELFTERLVLDEEMVGYLIKKIKEKIPENFQSRFQTVFGEMRGPSNPVFFRQYLVEVLGQDRGLRYGSHPVISSDEIDSMLYSFLPLFSVHELRERVESIITTLPQIGSNMCKEMMRIFDHISFRKGDTSIINAQQLQELCKALLCLGLRKTSTPVDYSLYICLAARKLDFALPSPLLFADTNWAKDFFGFVVNPGTGKLELWRFDAIGSVGFPMSSWKQWVDGSHPDRKWGIYNKPNQYGQY